MDALETTFGVKSELNVREAFSLYEDEIGYKIRESRDAFPDYELETDDGSKILAEAEKYTSDFIQHGHDVGGCDLIVCWYDDLPVKILPTIELGEHIDAPSEPERPNEFISVYDPGTHIKTIEMWRSAQDTLNMRFGWYQRGDNNVRHKSPNVPGLSADEFAQLFGQIDRQVREDAFVDIDFSSLIEWHESLSRSDKIRPDREGRMLASIDEESGGEKVLKLMNESNINISRYLESGKSDPRSQNSATIDTKAFRGVLSQIPREVRDQVFGELKLDALWRWHHNE